MDRMPREHLSQHGRITHSRNDANADECVDRFYPGV